MKKGIIIIFFLLFFYNAFAQQNISLTTEDKWTIYGSYFKGTSETCAIFLHSLENTMSEFKTFSERLQQENYCYMLLDLRGHGKSTTRSTYKDFAKTGQKNEFNKMVFDVVSAIKYLNSQGFSDDKIYLVGAGLGANVAAKTLKWHPQIAGVALLTPSLKSRDVVTLRGLQHYKKAIFIGVSAEERKALVEASIIRNASFLATGEGKVTFVTAFKDKGGVMLKNYMMPELLQWFKTPILPDVIPDVKYEDNSTLQEETENENN